MLPTDVEARAQMLSVIREIVAATGEPTGERAERLVRIEKLFDVGEPKKQRAGKAR